MLVEQRDKLIADLEKEDIKVDDHKVGISCRIYVPNYCLTAFVEMVKTMNKIEGK